MPRAKSKRADMKVGWKTEPIGEVCEIVNGGTPKTGVAEYWDGSHQWITPAEMGKRSTPYIDETARKLTDAGMANSSAQLLPPFSVILSSRAPIGHLVINTVAMATNQGCKGLVPSKAIHHKFLYYYLTSIVDLLNELGTGATFKELSGSKLKEVPVPIPPLPEQKRIVGILDEAFEGIATAKANAEKNLQNARALFESYLQSVFTQRGDGWVEKPLGECFKLKSGDSLTSKAMNAGAYPVFGGNGIAGMHNEFNLSGNNVIIGRVGALCGNARHINENIWLTDNAFRVIDFSHEFDGAFLTYLLNYKNLRSLARQAAQPVISNSSLKDLILNFPGLPEQRRIVTKLDSLREETQRLESIYQQKLAALDELKKSLLNQAFTGQL
ncbi:MAG TPA: restriction endonuclease subunit S [Anaerolineaceae bacterium]|nr:restriction endonuclease subunit S [Anaerolineaceae bacterium]